MLSFLIGPMAFVCIFCGGLASLALARRLPENHLGEGSRTAVSVAVAVVGTLAALVLGLLISTASNSFSARLGEVKSLSSTLIRIDRDLRRYGPEAAGARADLRVYVIAKKNELFPGPGQRRLNEDDIIALLEKTQRDIFDLNPKTAWQSWLRSQALGLTVDSVRDRWQLVQGAYSAIPHAFLIILVFWLTVVFGSIGLFAPRNGTVIAALFLCALAVSSGIALILELDTPFLGVVTISPSPMVRAITEVSRP